MPSQRDLKIVVLTLVVLLGLNQIDSVREYLSGDEKLFA